MLLRLYPFTVPPCFTLHLAVRADVTILSDAVWFGPIDTTEPARTLELQRGQRQPGINTDAVLDDARERGWSVLGSGFH